MSLRTPGGRGTERERDRERGGEGGQTDTETDRQTDRQTERGEEGGKETSTTYVSLLRRPGGRGTQARLCWQAEPLTPGKGRWQNAPGRPSGILGKLSHVDRATTGAFTSPRGLHCCRAACPATKHSGVVAPGDMRAQSSSNWLLHSRIRLFYWTREPPIKAKVS